MDLSSVELETPRLKLVSANRGYASVIYDAYKYPVTLYMNYPPPKSKVELEKRLIQREIEMQKGELMYLIVELKPSNEFLGVFAIEDLETNSPEIGCWLSDKYHGMGFGKEAFNVVIEWANKNLTFEYLKWPCAEKNIASCRLAERFGGEISKTYEKKNLTGYTWNYREYHIPKSR